VCRERERERERSPGAGSVAARKARKGYLSVDERTEENDGMHGVHLGYLDDGRESRGLIRPLNV
jgi:hypothetical protein